MSNKEIHLFLDEYFRAGPTIPKGFPFYSKMAQLWDKAISSGDCGRSVRRRRIGDAPIVLLSASG
jgi:hypothetical protein